MFGGAIFEDDGRLVDHVVALPVGHQVGLCPGAFAESVSPLHARDRRHSPHDTVFPDAFDLISGLSVRWDAHLVGLLPFLGRGARCAKRISFPLAIVGHLACERGDRCEGGALVVPVVSGQRGTRHLLRLDTHRCTHIAQAHIHAPRRHAW